MIKLHVIAVGDARVPFVDASGRGERGRYFGRAHDGKPLAEPVTPSTYLRRAINRGELAEVPVEAPAPPAPAPAPAEPPVSPATPATPDAPQE